MPRLVYNKGNYQRQGLYERVVRYMKLNELSPDCELQLELSVGKQKIYLDANIAQVARRGLVLYPVVFDGKVISFKNNKEPVNLIVRQPEGKPLIWKNVAIDNAVISQKSYVLVRSLEDAQEYNRRRNFRLDLDIRGTILGMGEVVIHDISNSGIGFYLEPGKTCKMGETVHIGFSVRDKNYGVAATVVRIVEGERRTLYGCSMMSTPAIDGFINEEQRIRIKGY